jgi:hypothetical protein
MSSDTAFDVLAQTIRWLGTGLIVLGVLYVAWAFLGLVQQGPLNALVRALTDFWHRRRRQP